MINELIKIISSKAGVSTYRIGLLQTKAYRILNQETAKVLKPYDITPVDWALLGLLYDAPNGLRLSELANELGVEAPFITERAGDLIKQKWVTITPSREDKRVKCMELTHEAKKKVPTIEKKLISAMRPLLSGSSIMDLKGYKRTLENIAQNKPTK